jgi:tRNA G10  N-methylase Trm11
MTVYAADNWPTNAALIADAASLYWDKGVCTLDPTYGRGLWWKQWRPVELVITDIRTGTDFRHLPFEDGSFSQIAYDPPYVSVGGRKTTTIPDLHHRYGLTDAPTSPRALQTLINEGLTELRRVCAPRWIVFAKCQDYISSGKLWPGTHHTLTHAMALGFNLLDRFEHHGSPRPQPPGRRQVHARRNLSTLFVLEAPK